MSGEEGTETGLRGAARAWVRRAAEVADVVEDAVEGAIMDVVGIEEPKHSYAWTATHQGPDRLPEQAESPPTEQSPHHHPHGVSGCTCRCCRHDLGGCCSCHDHGSGGGGGDPGGGHGGGNGKPGRPGRTPGHSRGDLDGSPVTVGDVNATHPKDSWPGVRKNLPLPFLFFRGNAGDTGTRPTTGPFWESPDVYLLAGVHPKDAPPIPSQLGETALAHHPNTVYAHVWNFGRAAAHDIIVEFYWCDPALGFNANRAHLIGRATAHLGARGSGRAHHVVKCPDPWVPTFVNGGHECLLVRAWDNVGDLLTTPEWDAAANRHLAQRNVHVIPAAEMGSLEHSVTISVGPLFGEPATVSVQREHPANMPWLQLHTGVRGVFPAPAPATGMVGLGLDGGAPVGSHQVEGDGVHVTLHATDDPPAPGAAHVYRVTGSQGGAAFGGYTVVVLG